ncbi:MAG: hypothetical protein IJY71_04540 [Clostridia bacterium]|nr:hypothetical protein [Clostridia bacterium]
MKKRWLALLLAAVLCISVLAVSAEGEAVVFRLNGEEYAKVGVGEITLPASPALEGGEVFIGWKTDVGGEVRLFPAGAVFFATGETTFDAVTVTASTAEAASVYAVGENVGLRFTSQIDKADYNGLLSLLGKDGFTLGTLIATTDYTAKIGGRLTAALLAAKGYEYLEIETSKIYKTTASYEEWAGSVVNLKAENLSRRYAAIGYLDIRYANGEEGRVYLKAAYINSQGNNAYREFSSVQAYDAFLNAYDDRNAGYQNIVKEGDIITYSPYTEAQLQKIKAYLDGAVSIKINGAGKYAVEEKGYYSSPYQVSYDASLNKDKVTITAKDGGALTGRLVAIVFAGSHLSFASLEKTDDTAWRFKTTAQTPDY